MGVDEVVAFDEDSSPLEEYLFDRAGEVQ